MYSKTEKKKFVRALLLTFRSLDVAKCTKCELSRKPVEGVSKCQFYPEDAKEQKHLAQAIMCHPS